MTEALTYWSKLELRWWNLVMKHFSSVSGMPCRGQALISEGILYKLEKSITFEKSKILACTQSPECCTDSEKSLCSCSGMYIHSFKANIVKQILCEWKSLLPVALLAFVYIKCQTIKVTLGFVNRTDELSYGLFELHHNNYYMMKIVKNLIDVQIQKNILWGTYQLIF